MARAQHTHKLKRLKYKSGNTIFFCCLPDCTFKTNIALALGKRSLCWRCGQEFILSEYSLRLAKPHCENCHQPKNGVYQEIEVPQIVIDRAAQSDAPIETAELSLAERMRQEINKPIDEEI